MVSIYAIGVSYMLYCQTLDISISLPDTTLLQTILNYIFEINMPDVAVRVKGKSIIRQSQV